MAFEDTQLTAAAVLLQCGPPLVLFCCIIAPRSLLIIVMLSRCGKMHELLQSRLQCHPYVGLSLSLSACACSAFLWASALLLLSALLKGG